VPTATSALGVPLLFGATESEIRFEPIFLRFDDSQDGALDAIGILANDSVIGCLVGEGDPKESGVVPAAILFDGVTNPDDVPGERGAERSPSPRYRSIVRGTTHVSRIQVVP